MFYKYFIDRPVFASVLSIVMTLAGALALINLPVAQYPEITPPTVNVSASYPGASAEVVEQSVASAIEEQVNGVEGMVSMSSTSSNDGSYSLTVTFEVGHDLDMATVEVQNRVSQAEPKLPDMVKRMGVTVQKQATDMLLAVNLTSPEETYDALFLLNYAKINLTDALSRVPGVGKVDAFGAGEFSLRIWVDPDKMASLGVVASDIDQALQDQNIPAPAGQIGQAPAPPGTLFQYSVKVRGQLSEVEEFENVIIKTADSGALVRLRDVAEVEIGGDFYSSFSRFSGKPTATLMIYQLPGANSLTVVADLRKAIEELSRTFPDDVAYAIAYDTTKFVSASIDEVVETLFVAFLLVFLVVFLFLQSWRATVIPMIAVPVSLIGAFIAFPILGFTLNTLTLFALVLAIGLVVDDAIVVVEAAQHNMDKEGMEPRAATLKAMDDVAGPVVANGLVIAAVFIPVAFLGGIAGQLYKQFALTLTVSVGISVFNALTLSPALAVLLLRPSKPMRGPLGWFFSWFNRFFEAFTRGYVATVRASIRGWALTLCVLIAIFGSSYGLLRVLPTGFVPPEDMGYFLVSLQLPPAASLERTDIAVRKIEAYLDQAEGVDAYITLGGFNILGAGITSYAATLFVILDPWDERQTPDLSLDAILAKASRYFWTIDDGLAFAFSPPPIPGLGSTGGVEIQIQDRAGAGVQELARVANEFIAAAGQRPEVASPFTSFSSSVPHLLLEVDRDKAKAMGVPLNQVYSALQAFLGGLYINDLNMFGRTYRVMLQAKPEFRARPENIVNFYVRNNQGNMVPLSTLVTVTDASGPEYIARYNVYPAVSVTAAAAPGFSSGQLITAMEQTAEQSLPPGFGYEWAGLALQEKESADKYGPVFALALLMVFLCLAALYESWAIPFAVLFALPLGVFGAYSGQWLRGLDNNVYAQIGLVMLIGLAAKNAVLIVEYAKAAYERGLSLFDATLEASRMRFRPILMTSLAFILGVLPMVIATGAGASARHALGTSVFAGMIAATFLGVVFVPFLYAMVIGMLDRLRGGRREAQPEPTGPTEDGTETP
ncbi:efflux RND transporter permease subunit [Desulfonatronum sp. SC1]|uniref:efflux RND transporter permease subunit n=1 Tax=Desulfonatronum sp. SC1 TaxID=2109626 RepID=UPI000D3159B7|nr:multidrug efflux RND transporter permease subunit [Desulfonatronum sp. SC1]PTN32789.1 hydrophobe/amphiphile efflux-1 family RND transporter [Desulfonatronum sp. SC1]